ncbi:hypothetical protein CDD82_2006 [Ophiocordyceps australis]|uniref:Uncharacterized protein n=1 Tax=Ophiocordyceps australis TaxID=1399860 RepID=A0A2C5Y4Q5_9HYPO|nr:hypothetical protein CDD82_2006 [Ophiocordyceps australis]
MAIRKWFKALVSPSSDRQPTRNARSMMEEDMRQWNSVEHRKSATKSAPEYGTSYRGRGSDPTPLFARIFARKNAAKPEAPRSGISPPLNIKQGLPSFIGDEKRVEPLTLNLIMETVDRLGKIFAHVPFLVQSSAAMAYHGHSTVRPNTISLACPPNAVSIMLAYARDMQMPLSSTAPSTFYVQMGYDTLCCVRAVARPDFGSLTAAKGSQVLSLANKASRPRWRRISFGCCTAWPRTRATTWLDAMPER